MERQDQATDVIPDRQKHLKLLLFFLITGSACFEEYCRMEFYAILFWFVYFNEALGTFSYGFEMTKRVLLLVQKLFKENGMIEMKRIKEK